MRPSFSNEEMNLIVDSYGGRKLFTELVMNGLYIKSGYYTKEESESPKRRIDQETGFMFLEYALMINSEKLGYSFSKEEKEKAWDDILFFSKFKNNKECIIHKNNKYIKLDNIWYEYKDNDLIDLDKLGKKVILAYNMDKEGLL